MHEDKYTYPSNVLHSNIPQEVYPTWILMTQMHVATYCGGGGVFAIDVRGSDGGSWVGWGHYGDRAGGCKFSE